MEPKKITLVVDANILLSALIKDGATRSIILLDNHKLYIPSFFFKEFHKHLKEIAIKTKQNQENLLKVLKYLTILGNIEIIQQEEINPYLEEAKKISPDINDINYFALALKFNCDLWSNDKQLKEQNIIKVYSTTELINSKSFQ